jgi:hypothetical protein
VAIRPGSRTARTTPRRRSFAGRRPPMALRWPGQGRAARRITTPPARLRLSWRLDRNRAAGGALAAPNAGGNALTPNMNDAALKAQIMGGWPFGGGGGQAPAPAVAPRARAQAPAPGFQPKKFFSNPVNWQYPFRCDRQAACQERRYFSGPIPPTSGPRNGRPGSDTGLLSRFLEQIIASAHPSPAPSTASKPASRGAARGR